MEDDADWDTSLKSQLHLFAEASQYILGKGLPTPGETTTRKSSKTTPSSPYGDAWDLLWLGHCGSVIKPNDPRRFLIENDPTTPPPFRRINQPLRGLVDIEDAAITNTTRLIFQTEAARCTYAYALSNRGARRTLATLSSLRRFEPFDVALSRLCREEERFKCLSVFPQLVGNFEKLVEDDEGGASAGGGRGRELALKGWGTPNIVYSTRLNMVRLLAGNKENFERQWPDDPVVEGVMQTRTLNRDV